MCSNEEKLLLHPAAQMLITNKMLSQKARHGVCLLLYFQTKTASVNLASETRAVLPLRGM